MPVINAPMAGTILEVLVAKGETVEAEDELLILESMKMEVPVEAPTGGKVQAVHVQAGDPVQEDDPLIEIA